MKYEGASLKIAYELEKRGLGKAVGHGRLHREAAAGQRRPVECLCAGLPQESRSAQHKEKQ